MKKYKNKILALGFIGILICGIGFWYIAEASAPSVYVLPVTLSKNVGETFDISIGVNTAGAKVCAVEGRLVLDKLSCQNVTVENGITPQSSPSCSNSYFLLGIPGCTVNNKILFNITVKAGNAGNATLNFSGVDVIGEGSSLSTAFVGGNYTLTISAPLTCNCTNWSSWQSGICGGGNCLSAQRLQARTRICTPAGCMAEKESKCTNDPSCISQSSSVETQEENIDGLTKEKSVIPTNEKAIQESLLASLAIIWGGFNQLTIMIVIAILCIAILLFISVKEWNLFRRKTK